MSVVNNYWVVRLQNRILLSRERETLDEGDEKIKSIFGNNSFSWH